MLSLSFFKVNNKKRKYKELNKLIKKCEDKERRKARDEVRVLSFISQGVRTVADKGPLCEMERLSMIIGSENELTLFPPVFLSFSRTLTVLNLDGNKISELPPQISQLSLLKVLLSKKIYIYNYI